MPPRSKVLQLPEEVRRELEQKLLGGGFADYTGLSEWLADKGYEVSKSAIHRFGQDFEEKLGAVKLATEQMRAMAAASDDPEGLANSGLLAMGQEALARVLLSMRENPSPAEISKLVRAIADIGRASVTQNRFATQVRERAAAAASKVDDLVKSGGMTKDAGDAIREQILGIARSNG